MPKLSMSVPHSLGQEEAVERLKEHFSSIKEAYGEHVSRLEEQWDDHVLTFLFTTRGVTVNGTVTIDPSDVKVVARLPLAAMIFKGRIESQIRERLSQMLV